MSNTDNQVQLDAIEQLLNKRWPENIIEPTLDRIAALTDALGSPHLSYPTIHIAGTNGKTTTARMIDQLLAALGYRVGRYTSPHLQSFTERISIKGAPISADLMVATYNDIALYLDLIDSGQPHPISYFEALTAMAFVAFAEYPVDIGVIEAGLGGQWDATNVVSSQVSVMTPIGFDHMEYLGDTRELIGFEKAGIFRHEKPAICADNDPPQSLVKHAEAIGAQLLVKGRDFDFKSTPLQWSYWGPQGVRHALPWPALRGRYQLSNAAAALTVLGQMGGRCPVSINHIREGMLLAENPGRFQVLPGQPTVVLDVAHNPHAAAALVDSLKQLPKAGRTVAVFSMLSDKEIASVIEILRPSIDHWWVAGIAGPRGCTGDYLCTLLQQAGITALSTARDLQSAFFAARKSASEDDKIIVFGSFYTVAAVMSALEDSKQDSKQYLTRSAQ